MLSNTGIASFHIIIFILIPLKPREFWGSFVSGLRLTNIHEAEKIPGLMHYSICPKMVMQCIFLTVHRINFSG